LDVKPGNIFLARTDDLTLKLGDFGIARRAGTTSDDGGGDALYMPPELLESDSAPVSRECCW
jgi:serine/threonine protein kinase